MWSIVAPAPSSSNTHSTCPFRLEMYSGEAPLVCKARRHTHTCTQHRRTNHCCYCRRKHDPRRLPHTQPPHASPCTTHQNLVDCCAPTQQGPYTLHVPVLASNNQRRGPEQRSGPLSLKHHRAHAVNIGPPCLALPRAHPSKRFTNAWPRMFDRPHKSCLKKRHGIHARPRACAPTTNSLT